MHIQLISASTKDFLLIAQLAKDIWHKHYVPIIGIEQVEYMLEKMYNQESLVEQTEKKGHQFFLINDVDAAKTIGFISISSDNQKDFWIHKFYVLSANQNKGVGTQVFEKISNIMNQPFSMRLTVNRQNYKSINFYFKIGFTIEQVADFDIGNGYYMNDFVMIWKNKTR